MTVDEFAKQFRWGTDPKTIKALEKMRTRDSKKSPRPNNSRTKG